MKGKIIIFGMVLLAIIAVGITFCLKYPEVVPQDTVKVSEYTGKVIQVDHISSTSGGLFFTSTRQDTYVTFDNGQTYWKYGYVPIIEGQIYNVVSVKTTSYGVRAGGNGTLTYTENTFTPIFSIEGK